MDGMYCQMKPSKGSNQWGYAPSCCKRVGDESAFKNMNDFLDSESEDLTESRRKK